MVVHAEQAASLMQAADQVRHDHIALPGAMRWLRRRVRLVRQALLVVIGLLPQHLAGCRAELTACRIPGTDRTRVAPDHARLAASLARRRLRCPVPRAARRPQPAAAAV